MSLAEFEPWRESDFKPFEHRRPYRRQRGTHIVLYSEWIPLTSFKHKMLILISWSLFKKTRSFHGPLSCYNYSSSIYWLRSKRNTNPYNCTSCVLWCDRNRMFLNRNPYIKKSTLCIWYGKPKYNLRIFQGIWQLAFLYDLLLSYLCLKLIWFPLYILYSFCKLMCINKCIFCRLQYNPLLMYENIF